MHKIPQCTALGAAVGVVIDAAGGGGAAAVDVDGGVFLHKGVPRASSSIRYAAFPALGSVISGRSFSSPTRSIPINVCNNWMSYYTYYVNYYIY